MSEETTNQEVAAPEVDTSTDTGSANEGVEVVTDESTSEAEGTNTAPPAEPEEDSEELDIDGYKFALPKSKAEKLKAERLMQADYTRKTQDLAEQRKADEAKREADASHAKAQQEYINDLAQAVAIDNALKQYDRIDWQQWNQQDQQAAMAAWLQRSQLVEARNAIAGQIQQKEQQRKQQEEAKALEAQQTSAKKIQDCYTTVARDIKGWGPELIKQLDKTASEMGFTNDELRQVSDPRFIKLLHKAHLAEQLLKKQTPPNPKPQSPAKPVPTVGGNAPAKPDPERMSMDDWVKNRRKEVYGK